MTKTDLGLNDELYSLIFHYIRTQIAKEWFVNDLKSKIPMLKVQINSEENSQFVCDLETMLNDVSKVNFESIDIALANALDKMRDY